MNLKINKYLGVLLLFLSSVGAIQGQEKDTLPVKSRLQQPFMRNLTNTLAAYPELLFSQPIASYVEIDLGYQSQNNTIRHAQLARKSQDIFFKAKGILPVKKVWLSGGISLQRNELEDVGYNLSNMLYSKDEVEKSPFFNLAYKEGDWENQFYTIEGKLAYKIHPRLIMNIGGDYKVSQYFRITNPVPKLTYLDVMGHMKITYAFTKNTSFGIQGYAGFLHNDIRIDFNGNAEQLNLPSNEAIFSRVSVGLGLIESAQSLLSARERQNSLGASVFYTFNTKQTLFSVEAKYLFSENSYDQLFANSENALGTYSVDHFQGRLSYIDVDKKSTLKLNLDFKSGSNFRVITNGKNYEASSLKVVTSYIKELRNFTYTLKGGFDTLKKTDFLSLNSFSYRNALVSTSVFYDLELNKGIFYTKFNPVVRFNIDQEESYLINTPYVDDVLEPFVIMNTSTRLDTDFTIGYQTKLKSETLLNIGLETANNTYLNHSDYRGTNTRFTAFLKIIY